MITNKMKNKIMLIRLQTTFFISDIIYNVSHRLFYSMQPPQKLSDSLSAPSIKPEFPERISLHIYNTFFIMTGDTYLKNFINRKMTSSTIKAVITTYIKKHLPIKKVRNFNEKSSALFI